MFLSQVINVLDAKGRISVPADFRAAVRGDDFDGIVVWQSVNGPYLEGGGMSLMTAYLDLLDGLDPYDETRIAFERSIFAQSRRLSFDSGGRVSLPKEMAAYAGLDGRAVFVGVGRRFEIWNPDVFEAEAKAARKFARENKNQLRVYGRPGQGPIGSGGRG